MTELNPEQLIDEIYAGALSDADWDRAIIQLSKLVHSAGAVLLAVDPIGGRILRDESHNVDLDALHAYRKYWITQDIRLEPSLKIPVGEPVFEHKLGLAGVWESSSIYNELLKPHDLPYFLMTWLQKEPGKVVTVSFQRTRKKGTFGEEECRTIKRFIPHLQRTLQVRSRLEAHQLHQANLTTALERFQHGLLMLDANGRILQASPLAEQMLREEGPVSCNRDRVLQVCEPVGAQLYALFRRARPVSTMFSLPRLGGLQDLSIAVVPMPAQPAAWIGADPCWLVFVFDAERRFALTAANLARDLNVSEREAEIAALLARGFEPSGISQRLGISLHTVRTHLRHIFDKTGTRSQTQLVRRILMRLPLLHTEEGG